MHWGIRRYQNKDGSLTELGRKRLGYSDYADSRSDDITLKKGTKVTRAVSGLTKNGDKDDNPSAYKQTVKKIKDVENNLDTKYVSVDGVRNSGRENGKDFYTKFKSGGGWEPDDMYIDTYVLKKDVKVASGKKVVDELLKQVGSQTVTDMLKNEQKIKKLTMKYTTDKELFKSVNGALVKQGYEAIEDINDHSTDMPVIFLNAKDALSLKSTQSGEDAVKELIKKLK